MSEASLLIRLSLSNADNEVHHHIKALQVGLPSQPYTSPLGPTALFGSVLRIQAPWTR